MGETQRCPECSVECVHLSRHLLRVHGKQSTPLGNKPYVSPSVNIRRWYRKPRNRKIKIVAGSFESAQ